MSPPDPDVLYQDRAGEVVFEDRAGEVEWMETGDGGGGDDGLGMMSIYKGYISKHWKKRRRKQ